MVGAEGARMHDSACDKGAACARAHSRPCVAACSCSLEKSRVAFAPVRGPIGATSVESALAEAQAAHARGAVTLHPMLPWR